MGLFWRLLAPKPLKKARRAMHPVSMLTPRPVRNVKRVAAKTINPIGALGDAAENAVVHAARGKKRRRRGGSGTSRSTGGGSAYATYDDVYEEEAPLSDADEREALGFPPLTLKCVRQGEALMSRTEAGSIAAVTIDDVLDPASPRADYDLPGDGQRLVAVRFSLENKGPGIFAYDPSYESKLIGASGGEYRSWQADLRVPTFNDVVRLGVGASRSAYVCYAVADEDRPDTVEVVFGIDVKAEIGQWKIENLTKGAASPPSAAPSDETPEKGRGELEMWTRMLAEVDVHQRQVAASALVRLAAPASRDVLLTALKDPDFEVRTHALVGLANIGGDGLIAALRAALQDSHPHLRQKTIKELGRVGGDEAVDAIRSARSDVDESVRAAAERELKRLGAE